MNRLKPVSFPARFDATRTARFYAACDGCGRRFASNDFRARFCAACEEVRFAAALAPTTHHRETFAGDEFHGVDPLQGRSEEQAVEDERVVIWLTRLGVVVALGTALALALVEWCR